METVDRDFEPKFEPKPGFSLIKYGNVLTLNFNQEFASRFNNILVDCEKNVKVPASIAEFAKQLQGGLNLAGGVPFTPTEQFEFVKYLHVYAVVFHRDFAQELSALLSHFLVQHRISPALFSFAKQLEACLYPRKFDAKTAYADEE
jgi:hypothetical protein